MTFGRLVDTLPGQMAENAFDLGMRWGGAAIAHRVIGRGAIFRCGCRFDLTTHFGAEWHLCPGHGWLEEIVDAVFSEQYGICSSAIAGRRKTG
jgi:hypothetical protein